MHIKKNVVLTILVSCTAITTYNAAGSAYIQKIKSAAAYVRYHYLPASLNPYTWFGDHMFPVQEGKCYRSKTLSGSALEKYIKDLGIKTVLNLREAQGLWYEKEKNIVASKLGSEALINLELNAKVLPTQVQIKQIKYIFDTCQQPLLVHCQAGADRTGFVAALWKLIKQDASLEQALGQQVCTFGHFEWRYPWMRKCTQILYTLKQEHGNWDAALDNYNAKSLMESNPVPSLPKRLYAAAQEQLQKKKKNVCNFFDKNFSTRINA